MGGLNMTHRLIAVSITAAFLLSGEAFAQTYGKNLVVNGDAESGPGTTSSSPPASIPGWTISGSPNVILYSAGDRMGLGTIGPANRGKNYFAGSDTAKATLTQKIDISAAASAIDAGAVSFDASAYVGIISGDVSNVTMTIQNASGASLSTIALGPLAATDVEDSGLYLRRKIGQMPAGARSVAVEVDLVRSSGSNSDASADNISFLLVNDAALPASFSGSNLILNGNAEAPNGNDLGGDPKADPQPALDLPGWVRTADFSLDSYPAQSDLAPTDPGPADRGSWYFYGGPNNPTSNAYQDIDVAAAASAIDAGSVSFAFSAWIGGLSSQNDNMTVTAQFMNWSGTVLGSSTLGPVMAAERNNDSALIQKSQSGKVPAGTRMVRVTMTANRTDGSDDDALADSLSLVLTVPGTGAGAPGIRTTQGVLTATAFGGSATVAPGTWVEIYGSNLAGSNSRSWAGTDFNGSNAPTSLDGTSVTIGGAKAYVGYISSGQVNAQIPAGVAPGAQTLTVTTPNGTSAAYPVTVAALNPGFLAPAANFLINGKQYVAALHADGTFVLPPGSIPGLATSQAKPGETILLYGVGFGPVSPSSIPVAGVIVPGINQLASTFSIQFAGATAQPSYAGLAPTYVGLYQFNVVVPNVADSDTVPVTFTLGGAQGSQTLYTAVKR